MMTINLKYGPGSKCWTMAGSEPKEMTVTHIHVYVEFDEKEGTTTRVIYHLSDGYAGYDRQEGGLCLSKQELKEKLFGK